MDKAAGSELKLREYRAGDWRAMYMLDLQCFEPAFQFSSSAMRGFAEAPRAVTILAEAEGKLVGFCIANQEEQIGYVITLDVATAWRQKGLARRLMAEVESRLQGHGVVEAELHVYVRNEGAIRFYEDIGYKRTGVAEDFYGTELDAFVYCKPLPI